MVARRQSDWTYPDGKHYTWAKGIVVQSVPSSVLAFSFVTSNSDIGCTLTWKGDTGEEADEWVKRMGVRGGPLEELVRGVRVEAGGGVDEVIVKVNGAA